MFFMGGIFSIISFAGELCIIIAIVMYFYRLTPDNFTKIYGRKRSVRIYRDVDYDYLVRNFCIHLRLLSHDQDHAFFYKPISFEDFGAYYLFENVSASCVKLSVCAPYPGSSRENLEKLAMQADMWHKLY